MEALASGASVQAWDGSTRGLDASSALDYIKSLRLITDACQRATIVSLYQASDTIFNLMDKVMLIDQGRMLYQGPATTTEAYFNALGYYRPPRQTMSDFLTSIASGNVANIQGGNEPSVPRSAVELEKAFRVSQAFRDIQHQIHLYETGLENRRSSSQTSGGDTVLITEALGRLSKQQKSKYVATGSAYNTSFFRQVLWCARRELWHLNGHRAPLISKFVCVFVLMAVLSQQGVGTVTGEMKIDNKKIDPSFRRRIGFCQQLDIHIDTSTVREAFEFSAFLRQDSKTNRQDKLAYVSDILEILEMTDLQNMLIRSLSLEQKKRTTIGVELCANPDLLLFLDEPTSGLDGQGAMSIVRLLRRLANTGQAILCTIHQASQEQFEFFDRVLALNRGGRVYYFGDVGQNGQKIIDYFTKNGVTVEPDKNVADLLIEVTAKESMNVGRDWSQIWQESDEAAAVLRTIDAITPIRQSNSGEQDISRLTDEYASSTYQQILFITKRTLLQYWRTPDYIYSRLYCSFAHSILNGLVFLQLGNTQADMQYRIFSCFLILMIVAEFINACAMMFDDNRSIWLGREYPSRVYGWVAFTTANIIAEIPYALAGAVLFYVLFYFLIGLPLGTPAGYTFVMMIMFHLFSTSWGQWIVALR
ncbi:hypothetical protein ACJ41O_014327 [Fusarium nematophilum]